MMTGEVTARREAIVSIRLRGMDGTELDVEAVLDTGFDDYFTLPAPLIAALGLPQVESVPIVLGDGQVVRVAVHEARVRWNDDWRDILCVGNRRRHTAGHEPAAGQPGHAGSDRRWHGNH